MLPRQAEIEEIAEIFKLMKTAQYSALQRKFLREFLETDALDLDIPEMRKVFNNKIKIADALETIMGFSQRYQDEDNYYIQFKGKINALLRTLSNLSS